MLRKLTLTAIGSLLIVVTLIAIAGWWLFHDLPAPAAIPQRLVPPSVRITDRHGRILYNVVDAEYGRHANLPLEDVPLRLQQATIATEDKNFYTNPGVDVQGIVRAFWINLRGREVLAGGSTITQQVARTLLLDADERAQRTIRRKLRESWLAWRIARSFSKEEILALYLNQTYYGAMAYGVEAAAQTYFGKTAANLTLAESALIAGLPQAPALYNPFTDPDAARARQEIVLDLMLAAEVISSDEHTLALREPLRLAATPYPVLAPHFVMMVQAEVDRLFTPDEVYTSGGLAVRTTLDLDWQQHAETIIQEQLYRLNHPADGGPSHNAQNGSLVSLDPHTGEILALVGSPDYFDESISGAVNMALVPRQPGSALKPLIYAAALAPNRAPQWTAATVLPDVRTVFMTHENEPYVPVNFSRSEHGPVRLRPALASSLNIPAVLALDALGVEAALDFASSLGITTLGNATDYDLSFALGGGPVRLLDLTAAYGAFASGGVRVTPQLLLDVTTVTGEVVYTAAPPEPRRVMDERIAWLISNILSDDDARAIGFGRNSLLQLDRIAAVKTGTTNDFHDNWTIGYTPQLVTGVWVGNASNEPMRDVTGLSGAGPIWHYLMRTLLAGQPDAAFPQPAGLVQVEVCALSGLLPTEDCPYRVREWFLAGTQPQEYDTYYRRVLVDSTTGQPVNEQTPPEREVLRSVLDLPMQYHDWARAEGLLLLDDLIQAQDVMQETAAAAPTPAIQFTSPDPRTVYRISPELPPEAQKLRLAVVTAANVIDVTFWLDSEPLRTINSPPYEIWWALESGEHVLTAKVRQQNGRTLTSQPLIFTVLDAEPTEP